jgi:sugar diacid utilization regulator
VFPVGSGFGSRLTSWLLVAEGDYTTWPRDQVEAIRELAAVAALDRSRREERLSAVRPILSDALTLIEEGAPHAEVATRARQAGLPPGVHVVVAVADLHGERGATENATELLEDVALALGPALVAQDRDGHPIALLPAQDDVTDHVRTAFGRLAPGLSRGVRLSVGLSSAAEPGALAGALEQARFAHQVACTGSEPVVTVSSDEVTSHALLLAAVPDDVRRAYAHRVLGKVVEHDRRTHGDLIATLTEFLACSGSWARTAEALHLHVNTVRYRIERIQELTGRDVAHLEDRVDVFLALKSL